MPYSVSSCWSRKFVRHQFLSPPVHIARHVTKIHWIIIHISKSIIIDRPLIINKYISLCLYSTATDYTLRKIQVNVNGVIAVIGRVHCQCQVVFLADCMKDNRIKMSCLCPITGHVFFISVCFYFFFWIRGKFTNLIIVYM